MQSIFTSSLGIVFGHRKVIYALCITFIFGIIFGVLMPPDAKIVLLNSISDKFGSILNESLSVSFKNIFINNTKVSLIQMISGIFIFVPFLIIFANGMIIGVLADFIFRMSYLTPQVFTLFILALIPHGVIEIPTMIFTSSMGVLLGLKIFFQKRVFTKDNRRETVLGIIKSYVIVIIPLLLIAAFVEVYITGALVSKAVILVKKQYENTPEVLNLIATKEDLETLGVKVELLPNQSSSDNGWNQLRLEYDVFYDENIFNKIKALQVTSLASANYKTTKESNNTGIHIQITKFSSISNAQNYLLLVPELSKKKGGADRQVVFSDTNTYKVTTEGTSYVTRFGTADKYVYSVSYTGNNMKLFDRIFKLQKEKVEQNSK